jgi:hypothetical protein
VVVVLGTNGAGGDVGAEEGVLPAAFDGAEGCGGVDGCWGRIGGVMDCGRGGVVGTGGGR